MVSTSPTLLPAYVEGDHVSVVCEVQAEPKAGVFWYRALSGEIVARSAELVLHNVTRVQAGEYHCKANNTVGTSNPANINIAVQCKYNTSLC